MKKLLFPIIPVLLLSCAGETDDSTKLIAISKFYPKNEYQTWFNEFADSLSYVSIYDTSDDSIDYYLSRCSGIVLTGGGDMDPANYGREDTLDICSGIDPRRDSLDMLLVNIAFDNNIPILGVCRGMQVMNVNRGGTLFTDLPAEKQSYIHKKRVGDMEHDVYVTNGEKLHEISKCLATIVNSNHHQAIDQLADGFSIQALAPDSVIEAIWWDDLASQSFALGVMWHPERLDSRNNLSGNIAKSFIDALQ